MINLHDNIGPSLDGTPDPWISVRLASVNRHVTDCPTRPTSFWGGGGGGGGFTGELKFYLSAATIQLNIKGSNFTTGLTLSMLGNFSCFCCHLLTFFLIIFFNFFSRTLSVCQTVWIQIRTDILSVLIWAQTVCKGYQQTNKSRRWQGKSELK